MSVAMVDQDLRKLLGGRASRGYLDYAMREVETSASGRFLEGRAVPYNVWTDTGWYMERIMPGTFTKSIQEAANGLPLLLFHDSRKFPVGVAEQWREESDGLYGVWRMDEDDDAAMRALAKAGKGMLSSLSVGFVPIENWIDDDGRLRDVNNEVEIDDTGMVWVTRRQARLLEVSLTPTPAYAGADVLAVRELRAAAGDRVAVPDAGGVRAERPKLAAMAARMKEMGL